MEVETLPLILAGLGAAVSLVLLALLINLFRAMTRFALVVGAVLAFLVVGVVALSLVTWPLMPCLPVQTGLPTGRPSPVEVHLEQPASAARPGPSAAVTVTRFLLTVIVGGVVITAGTVLTWQWWKERQKRERLQETLQQAQLYALASGGARLPTSTIRRLPQGGNVIVVGGQQPTPTQAVDFPDEGGWEVVQ